MKSDFRGLYLFGLTCWASIYVLLLALKRAHGNGITEHTLWYVQNQQTLSRRSPSTHCTQGQRRSCLTQQLLRRWLVRFLFLLSTPGPVPIFVRVRLWKTDSIILRLYLYNKRRERQMVRNLACNRSNTLIRRGLYVRRYNTSTFTVWCHDPRATLGKTRAEHLEQNSRKHIAAK